MTQDTHGSLPRGYAFNKQKSLAERDAAYNADVARHIERMTNAAPDLLHDMKDALAVIESVISKHRQDGLHEKAYILDKIAEKWRNTISKAEGKQP